MKKNSATLIQPKAVIYARVARREQAEGELAMLAQLKLLHQYAKVQGISVLHEYVDVGSTNAKRPSFTEMVKFLQNEKKTELKEQACCILLVERTDRLYRKFKDYVTIDDLDLEIHLVKENVILTRDSRSSEKFIHGIKVLMAKHYIDSLSEEVKTET